VRSKQSFGRGEGLRGNLVVAPELTAKLDDDVIALVAGSATAADLPVGQPVYSAPIVVPFSWSGFYLGGNIGGHVGNDSLTTTTGSGALIAPAEAAAIDAASPATL
jgi:hypothetical protein